VDLAHDLVDVCIETFGHDWGVALLEGFEQFDESGLGEADMPPFADGRDCGAGERASRDAPQVPAEDRRLVFAMRLPRAYPPVWMLSATAAAPPVHGVCTVKSD
jgi:hypothetical protein